MFTGMELYVVVLLVGINSIAWSSVYRQFNPLVHTRVSHEPSLFSYETTERHYRLETIRTHYHMSPKDLHMDCPEYREHITFNMLRALANYIKPFITSTEEKAQPWDRPGITLSMEIKVGVKS